METCHASHFLGIPHLLKGVVFVSGFYGLESFRQFMFAGSDHTRFCLLCGLNIWVPFTREKIAEPVLTQQMMTSILQNANNLQYLAVAASDCDGIFQLRRTGASSPTEMGYTFFQEILKSLVSPIPEISLGVVGFHGSVVGAPFALVNFKDTLTTLELQGFLVDDIGFQLHRVQVLTIRVAKVPNAFLGTLAQIFPNLRKLSINSMRDFLSFQEEPRAQAQSREASERWGSLESICGRLWFLCTLGITFPIRHISTHCGYDPLDSGTQLMALLQDVGPSTVAFRVKYREIRDGEMSEVLHTASRSHKLEGLHLEIDIGDHIYHPPEKLAAVEVCLLPSFSKTPVGIDHPFFIGGYAEVFERLDT